MAINRLEEEHKPKALTLPRQRYNAGQNSASVDSPTTKSKTATLAHKLSTDESPTSPAVNGKSRCWICWEKQESSKNRLIKVCNGCKDVDLKWVHQDCIDQFIGKLPPTPLTPRIPQLEMVEAEPEGHVFVNGRKKQIQYRYNCSRCNDPYIITKQQIHPLVALWTEDVQLKASVALMSLCILIITYSCAKMLLEARVRDEVVFRIGWGMVAVHKSTFAVAMFILCHAVNAVTWKVVISFCSGRSIKRVTSVSHIS
ncbi:hypothetical protein SmJEL517_g02900 [Synchytrium microbalum]|uniref:RING-CH-type domain-containing protein n=1 Tax=Synchytrium microbalum TaxID=1806994 RepID=A0A507CAF6_9FUNG|nr:uncharacterized protein SmJEL517_g02900 [Synchytrium microbalum]TPX34523.1 hypothetical protein SmJEL517_g02900 [Synchytrium microbalum]